jgi:hypothetical protein
MKQPLSACMITKNKKIKIVYTNGYDKNFGSLFECAATLDAMYNLRLFWENYIFIKGPLTNSNITNS